MRIAMWSGPRNLSTAMMYSFGNRDDFSIMDEPFYAPYLAQSGADHPMRDVILDRHETDPNKVGLTCSSGEMPHLYMKHMPHHMLKGFPMDWAEGCVHIHLLRHPARVVASYAAKRADVSMNDIGFAQQLKLYQQLGGTVIDSTEIRANPSAMLRKLCSAIDLPFDDAMLSWDAGPRSEDGIWAEHWYGAVHQSTGFAPPEKELPTLEPHLQQLVDTAMPMYEAMAADKITP